MFRPVLLLALALVSASTSYAQTGCPPPMLHVLSNGQEVPPTGAPLAPRAQLQINPDPACATTVRYELHTVELTLMRRGRPVLPTKVVQQTDLNLVQFAGIYQPGDRLHIFVPYQSLVAVAADGTKSRYRQPAPKPKGVDLSTDEQKGISFSWLLRK